MNGHTLAAVVLAVLLVSVGGVAAVPGDAPTDAPTDGGADAPAAGQAENASGSGPAASERNAAGSVPDETPRATDSEGPAVTLPDRVPDHVSEVHDLVRQFRTGDLGGSLGEAISGLTDDDIAAHTSG